MSAIVPNIRLNSDLVAIPKLRDRLRKLRWFVSAFKVHTALVEQETGLRFTIDEGRLNAVFFDWVDLLGARRRGLELDVPDFFVFAAGLALTCLARHDPASVDDSEDTVSVVEILVGIRDIEPIETRLGASASQKAPASRCRVGRCRRNGRWRKNHTVALHLHRGACSIEKPEVWDVQKPQRCGVSLWRGGDIDVAGGLSARCSGAG